MKLILSSLLFVLFISNSLEAQWTFWGQKYCWGCRRYMDFTLAGYDGYYYGYIDNLNYPSTYALPRNRYFNYCPPCPGNNYNFNYLQNCIRFTNQCAQ